MLHSIRSSFALLPAIVFLLLPGTAAWSAPLDPTHVAADAKWVIHVDYEALGQSELLKTLRDEKPQVTQAIQGWMKKRYGINPPKDLKSATMFSRDYKQYTGTVLIQADYDRDKVETMLRKSREHRTTEHDCEMLHTILLEEQPKGSPSGDKEMTVVLLDDDTILLASSVENAKTTLKLLSGNSPSLADAKSPLLTEKAQSAWIYGAAIDLKQLKDHPVAMPVLAQHQRITWAFGKQDDGKLYEQAKFVARDESVAEQMHQVLQGLIAYETLWADGRSALTKMMKDVELTRDGTTVGFHWQGKSEAVAEAVEVGLERAKSWMKLLKDDRKSETKRSS
ncbi:MAG: hypothetical protein R3C05_13595 [Pirellulaceae bacterium]